MFNNKIIILHVIMIRNYTLKIYTFSLYLGTESEFFCLFSIEKEDGQGEGKEGEEECTLSAIQRLFITKLLTDFGAGA